LGALISRLLKDGLYVFSPVRNEAPDLVALGVNVVLIDPLTLKIDWANILEDIDMVIHLVGRSHILSESSSYPLSEFRYINVKCSLNLAEHAIRLALKNLFILALLKLMANQPMVACSLPRMKSLFQLMLMGLVSMRLSLLCAN